MPCKISSGYARPAARFVAGFIGKMNQLPGRVVATRQGYVQCGVHKLQVPPETIAKPEVGSVATVLVRPETIMMTLAGSEIDAEYRRDQRPRPTCRRRRLSHA